MNNSILINSQRYLNEYYFIPPSIGLKRKKNLVGRIVCIYIYVERKFILCNDNKVVLQNVTNRILNVSVLLTKISIQMANVVKQIFPK